MKKNKHKLNMKRLKNMPKINKLLLIFLQKIIKNKK